MAGFKLNFTYNKSYGEEVEKFYCTFAKYDNNHLLLLCLSFNKDEINISLKKIKDEIEINDKNVLYNYRIQPVKREETILYNGTGSFFIDIILKN